MFANTIVCKLFVYLFVCDLAAVGGLQLPPFGDGKMPEPRGGVASSSVRVHIDRSVGVVVGRAALAGGALRRLRVEDEGILGAIGIILGSEGGLHRIERIRRKGGLWGQRRCGWAGGVGTGRSGSGAGTRAG